MPFSFVGWTRWSLFNLLIVATAGLLLRYKIAFSLPWLHQKNLLHAHSHFAFSGWVSLALCICLLEVLSFYGQAPSKKYSILLWIAQLFNYGMLFSFPFGGYTAIAIIFSTGSILLSYLFAYNYYKDAQTSIMPVWLKKWFLAGLAFYTISSIGAFNLAYLMLAHSSSQEWYIGSIYFFLHFQYNGWFIFALAGLFLFYLSVSGFNFTDRQHRAIFLPLLVSCLPAFFLSALWMRLPAWCYVAAVVAVLLQWLSLFNFLKNWNRLTNWRSIEPNKLVPKLWALAGAAFLLKLILQSLSLVPSLTYFAFGFRPIVIGYLHLVLLGIVTLFMLGYLITRKLIDAVGKVAKVGIYVFTLSVLLNEFILMLQGVFALKEIVLPGSSVLLFLTATGLFSGLALLLKGQSKSTQNSV